MDQVNKEQVEKAIQALLKHIRNQKKLAENLISPEESVHLVLAINKIPENRKTTPSRIPLPNAPEAHTVCLFVKDPKKEAKETIEKAGIKVDKIIALAKLKTHYKPFQAKRNLCNSYDQFLADDCILHLLPNLLGKSFYEKKKLPLPVNLLASDLKKEMNEALSSTSLFFSTGPSLCIKIGNSSQSAKALLENVLQALPKIVDKIPRKWENIKSLHLKTASSIALPIFVAQE